jgi:L-seryl-tRNA(Ser) seleniumtransferase
MRANRSNFVITGFTESPRREELVALGQGSEIPVFDDLGSGCLVDLSQVGISYGDKVQDVLEAGVDLVAFSGDKLLGGPQAGILLGTPELVGRLRRHPLARALRPDKLTLAALEAVVRIYSSGDPWRDIPVLAMLKTPLVDLQGRCAILAERLAEVPGIVSVEVVETAARVGGGALPETSVPSVALRIEAEHISTREYLLRAGDPIIIGRMEEDGIILDLRTIDPVDDKRLGDGVVAAFTASLQGMK